MTKEYVVRRYGSYFRGWCQAFGVHESIFNDQSGSCWLFSEHQVGLLLQPQLKKSLFKEILRKTETPVFHITEKHAQIGSLCHVFSCEADKQAYHAIKKILTNSSDTHLYLTSHFSYGTDARILTLSNVKPLYILYKEIGDIYVKFS